MLSHNRQIYHILLNVRFARERARGKPCPKAENWQKTAERQLVVQIAVRQLSQLGSACSAIIICFLMLSLAAHFARWQEIRAFTVNLRYPYDG